MRKKEKVVKQPKNRFYYICPACTNKAIETSNKMLGVNVNCASCGKLISLNNARNYKKL